MVKFVSLFNMATFYNATQEPLFFNLDFSTFILVSYFLAQKFTNSLGKYNCTTFGMI